MKTIKSFLGGVQGTTEKYLPLFSVTFLLSGFGFSSISPSFAIEIRDIMNSFIGFYSYFAPLAIYIILAPSLAKLLDMTHGKSFVRYSLKWLLLKKFAACIFGALFTAVIFSFPFSATVNNASMSNAISGTLGNLGWMLLHSVYFYAVYAAIITVIISSKIPALSSFLGKVVEGVEACGPFLMPFIPLFMLAIGSYIYSLPIEIEAQFLKEGIVGRLNPFKVIFLPAILVKQPLGMILVYFVASLLTGLACFLWHGFFLALTRFYVKGFSISHYIKNYWLKVYPLLWATASEALAAPLNLHLVQKYYPEVKDEIRRLVIGVGSFLNIDGTIICVFIMLGVVAKMAGIELSLVQLLLCIPVVYLISLGVPGIPGELLLFAGPLATLLNIQQPLLNIFIVLYLGLQIGLPDSFRTGSNSTDNCVLSILLNKVYEEKYLTKGGE